MPKAKVSLICTVRNEESSIREFLNSLLTQSRSPDEIVIVDGGSTDSTVEIINSYIRKAAPIKLIIRDRANIPQGRNIAIKNAKYDIIASTDAGCRLDKNWLKNLIKPFEEDKDVDVVAGWYEPDARTDFEECVAELTYPKLEKVLKNPDTFLPSSRSVAYRKKCWEKVRGYPEWLDIGEDTLFDLNLKRLKGKFTLAHGAVVYWRVRSSLQELFRQHYQYARGDAEGNLVKITGRYHSLILCVFGIFFSLLLLRFHYLYFVLSITMVLIYYIIRYGLFLFIKFKKAKCLWHGPSIALTTLASNILGMIVGRVTRK